MTLSVLVFAVALAQAAPGDSGSYPVTGTGTDAVSGRPLSRVRLTLELIPGGDPHFSAVTGGDGRFSFRAPAGKYHLIGERAGYPSQELGQLPGRNFSTSVIAGPGKVTTDIAFRLYPGAAIAGRVVDDLSDPVANADVYALGVRVVRGHRQLSPALWARTDSAGEYRLAVPAGAYYLAVIAVPWFADRLELSGEAQNGDAAVSWPVMFSGNTTDPLAASLVTVTPGGEASADFALPAAKGSTLHFHIDSKEQGLFSVSLMQRGPDGYPSASRDEAAYGGEIRNVYPGKYELAVDPRSGSGKLLFRSVDVTGGDVDVDLSGLARPTLSGRVRFDGETPKSDAPLQLGVRDEVTLTGMPIMPRPDGTFDQPSVLMAGRYRVSVDGAPYRVRSIQAEGAKVEGTTIEIAEPGPLKLDIVISYDVAKIEGVLRRGDHPVSGAAVMLIPRQRDGASSEDQTDSDGSFNLANLPLGDYDLLILESGEHIEYTRPEVLAPYRDQLRPVHVGKRGTQTLDVDLDEPAVKPAQ